MPIIIHLAFISGYGPYFGLLYIIDILYWIDVTLQLRTAIKDETGAPIDDPKVIFATYRRSWKFWLDLASIIPIEFPFLAIANAKLVDI